MGMPACFPPVFLGIEVEMTSWLLSILLLVSLLSPEKAEGHAGHLPIRNQRDFDRLDASLDSLSKESVDSIVVSFLPGTYFFREGHVTLAGLHAPNLRIVFEGNDAAFIGEGETVASGDHTGPYRFEDSWYTCPDFKPFLFTSPLGRCRFFPIPTRLSFDSFKIPADEPDLSEEEARDVYIIITQWFYGVRYKVDKIRNGYIYYHATGPSRTPWYTELRFGRCLPRYQLLNHPSRPVSISGNRLKTRDAGKPLFRPSASNFLSVRDSRIGSITLEGCRFLGNDGRDTLVKFSSVQADSLTVRSCRFRGIRGTGVASVSSSGLHFCGNDVSEGFLSALVSDFRSPGTVVSGNLFRDNGLAFTNAPVVLCQGPDLLISRNRFEDFTYSAIGVGVHYTVPSGLVTSGRVEYNEISHSPSFGKKPMRSLIDSGAIYVWTQNRDLTIFGNYVHDIYGYHGNRGIFCDDGVVNVTVRNNLVLHVESSYPIDVRRYFKVSRRKGTRVVKGNLNNKIYGNIVDGSCRLFVRKDDPGSLLECNRVLKRGYDREEVVSQWKRSLP